MFVRLAKTLHSLPVKLKPKCAAVVISSSCWLVIAYLPTGCKDKAGKVVSLDDTTFDEEQFKEKRKRNKRR